MIAKSPSAQFLHNNIERFLTDKGIEHTIDADGDITFLEGSTRVFLRAMDMSEDHIILKISAPVAIDVESITPALGQALLEANFNVLFGKFSFDAENGVIWFEHVLLGNSLDSDELIVAIGTIVATADDYDESVASTAGGKRFVDAYGVAG